jgi:uncharacterized protein YegL
VLSQNNGYQVWPFYFLCDESASMSGAAINAVNESLQKVWTELIKSPAAADKAWVSVISFSDTAKVLVPLTDLYELSSMPGCVARGQANYGNAFRKLKQVMEHDEQNLRNDGFVTNIRPIVVFMSRGEPVDEDWREAHTELINGSSLPFSRPHIVSFGIGSADGQTILDVATDVGRDGIQRQAYLTVDGFAPEKVIAEIIHLFISSGPISSAPRSSIMLPMPEPIIDLLVYFVYEDQEHLQGVVQSELDELKNGMVNAQARHNILFSVIAFADDAEVSLPLTKDPNHTFAIASRKLVKGRSNFANVFRKIRDVIDSDVTRLKSTGRQVLRPVVIFMSECKPESEEWRVDHAALVDRDNPYWPNIITIGIGQADRPSTVEFASDHGAGRARPAHLFADGINVQTVFEGILDQLPSQVLFEI